MSAEVDIPVNFRWLIAGVTGSGKSYLTGFICEELRRQRRRFIVLDAKKDNLRGLSELKNVHEVKVISGKAYNWFKAVSKDFLVIYPSEKTTTEELMSQYEKLLETLYYNDRDRVIVIEEAHHLAAQHSLNHVVELLVREGRGKGLSAIFTTQRIQDFSKLVWSQCDRTFIFKWFIPHDILYISKMIPNFEQINRELQQHDVLEYNHRNGAWRIIKAHEVKRITPHYG